MDDCVARVVRLRPSVHVNPASGARIVRLPWGGFKIGESPQAMIQRLRLEKCYEVLSQTGADGASMTRITPPASFGVRHDTLPDYTRTAP